MGHTSSLASPELNEPQVVDASGSSLLFPVGQAEAEGLPCLPVAHSRDGFGEAAPPVCSGGQQRDWPFGILPELVITCSSAHSPHGLVTDLVALRLARCPWEGWPEQNVFHYYLFMPLETVGFSPSAHPAPDTFLPLVFINSVPFTFFHPLWLSAKEKMSAGLQSSPR